MNDFMEFLNADKSSDYCKGPIVTRDFKSIFSKNRWLLYPMLIFLTFAYSIPIFLVW